MSLSLTVSRDCPPGAGPSAPARGVARVNVLVALVALGLALRG